MSNNIIKYYDSLAETYSKRYNWNSIDKEILILFEKRLQDNFVNNLWDLGCGHGQTSKFFADKGYEVVGLDISTEMLKIAQKINNHKKIRYVQGSIENFIESEKRSLTGVLCLFSLIHHPKIESRKILWKIIRKLKPGSLLLISVQLGDDEIIRSPITKQPINIFGWKKEKLEKVVLDLGLLIKFTFTRSSWETEIPMDKLFLILEVR